MSLNFTQIEIKTANFVNSWGDGVLVMVSGLVQTKEYSHQRKFIQMFFLAPQEKGYFVLNDYFHFVDQEHVQPAPVIGQEDYESNLAPNTVVETGMELQIFGWWSILNKNLEAAPILVFLNPCWLTWDLYVKHLIPILALFGLSYFALGVMR